jgi:hypothetical protein
MTTDEIVVNALNALHRRSYYTFSNFMYCGVVEDFKRNLMSDIRRPLGFLAWENAGVTIVSMFGVSE